MISKVTKDSQFIEIYFFSKLSTGRSAIEDDLDEILGDKGEVIEGGSGISGSNIDIEIYEGSAYDFIESIKTLLQDLEVPKDTAIVIDEKQLSVY